MIPQVVYDPTNHPSCICLHCSLFTQRPEWGRRLEVIHLVRREERGKRDHAKSAPYAQGGGGKRT